MAENSGDLSLGYMMGQSENRGGGFGGMFGEGLWAIIILAMLGFGGGYGFGGGFGGAGLQGIATRADINEGFALQNITGGIHGLERGLCDGFYNISSQLAQCCCDNRAAIADLKYSIGSDLCGLGNAMQSGFRDVIESQRNGTREILDFLVKDKISTLTAENQSLKFAASQAQQNAFITANQEAQTAELIRRIAPMPVPAYSVPAPYPYGYAQGGCGCGC